MRRLSDRDRREPSKAIKAEILEQQKNCCFYCGRRFGSIVYDDHPRMYREGNNVFIYWRTVAIALRVHFDHVKPWIHSQDNSPDNFVAACHICNGMKGSESFADVEDARKVLKTLWKNRRLSDTGVADKAPRKVGRLGRRKVIYDGWGKLPTKRPER